MVPDASADLGEAAVAGALGAHNGRFAGVHTFQTVVRAATRPRLLIRGLVVVVDQCVVLATLAAAHRVALRLESTRVAVYGAAV